MLTLLKIIGLVAIVGCVVVVGGLVLVVRWLRKVLKAAAHTPTSPPCRVYPEPEPNPQWRTPAKIHQYAGELKALGFQEVGAFSIPQMQGLLMLGFVHPGERLYATIYDHQRIPPSFDIACDFEDQTGLTASSSKMGRNLDKRPHHPILWLGDERAEVVLQALQQHPQPAPRLPVSAADYLSHFKRSYAEGMNWRMKKGGVSREEIRRQGESKGKQMDAEIVEQVYKEMRRAHVLELQRGCLAQYLDEQHIPAAEWEPNQGRAVVIPETLEPDELVAALERTVRLDQEQRHTLNQLRRPTGQTALDLVEEILSRNTAALGLEKLGEVTEPVRAYVLLAPAPEEVPVSVCS